MKKDIGLFSWQNDEKEEITSIGNDLILLEKPIMKSRFKYPFKTDMITAIICLSGKTEGFINLKSYTSAASSLTIILPDQILQHTHMSEDFSGLFIVMSKNFINNLNIESGISLFMSIYDNPVVFLSKDDLQSIVTYYTMLKDAIKRIDNPYRMETIQYLTKAFFYGTSYQFHESPEHKSKNEIVVDKFLALVRAYYKHERTVRFYADKLCLTPKYLGTLIKKNTSRSASVWIDRYVVLEAQALLKSTNMTIQQISNELNFPSQSFFGKYFKRFTGMSPKEYKKK